ncbi:MAG: dipeptide epimerase [Planctomycetaceae bacterium]|nr:dipeptide epimerase [Planctomycetaceae bacterium]
MRIAEIIVYRVRIPLKTEIRHASHARTETASLVVQCRLDNGQIGWGEGLPREYVTGETIDDAWALIARAELSKQLGGSFETLADVIALLDRFHLPPRSGDDRGCFGNSARCAIELAVLDAYCRSLGVPLSGVTAALPETIAIRGRAEWVRYSAAFTAMSPWKQTTRALLLRLFGFHQAKVKVGMADVDDVATLRRIRGIVGRGLDLRIDANEAWTCENLATKLSPLVLFGITAVEQPVPHAAVAGLATVRPSLGVPIMLDESLCGEIDARRAIEQGTCDLFNIRLSKCGGFLPSLRLAALAHQAGLGYQLGCQVGETGILSAAGRHFAASVGGLRYLEGSYDRFLVAERLTTEDLTFGYGGYAPALPGPGLGITVDPVALQRVTVTEQRIKFAT